MDIPVNYLAVLLAGVATMVIGFVWYGPLFGAQWAKLMGWSAAEGSAKMKKAHTAYAISFVGALVMAYVLSHVIYFANAFASGGINSGLSAGFWMWLGFVVPVTVGSVLWDGKPLKLWYINAGYYLVTLLVMGMILGYMQ